MPRSFSCFNDAILWLLSSGQCHEPLFSWYMEHLDGCTACQSKLSGWLTENSPTEKKRESWRHSEKTKNIYDSTIDFPPIAEIPAKSDLPSSAEELGHIGDYRVLRKIGSGNSSIVFEAEDLWLNRRVALKFLRMDIDQIAEARLMFLAEAQTLAAIQHENLVPVLNVGQENDNFFMVMPLLEGETLASALEKGAFSVESSLKIIGEVAAGLSALHKAGLLHCELKPTNIWLRRMPDGSQKAVLLDFGMAATSSFRVSSLIKGTISPEQIGGDPVDVRTDLFALGCLLLQMLCPAGNKANPDQNLKQFAEKIAPVRTLLDTLLATEMADRPENAGACIRRIHQLQKRKSPRWLLTGGIAASIALAAMGFEFQKNRQHLEIQNQFNLQAATQANAKPKSTPIRMLMEVRPELILPVGKNVLVSPSPVGQLLCAAEPGGRIKIFAMTNQPDPEVALEAGFDVARLSLGKEGQVLAAIGNQGQTKIWKMPRHQNKREVIAEKRIAIEKPVSMVWTDEPKSRLAVAAGKQIHLINPWVGSDHPEFHLKYEVPYEPVNMVLRPEQHEIICVVKDGGLMVWDFKARDMTYGMRYHNTPKVFFASNRKGTRLGTTAEDGLVFSYDGKPVRHKPEYGPYWRRTIVNYFHATPEGMTFVDDEIALIKLKTQPDRLAQFSVQKFDNTDGEIFFRVQNRNIVRMFDSASQSKFYGLDDQGNFLVCDLSGIIEALNHSD